MSEDLRKTLRQLELISLIKRPQVRKAVLTDISCQDCYYKALREILLNTIKGNVPLSEVQKRKLRRYKSQIRAIICPKKSKKLKAKAVIQSGGWLPILLPVITSVLGEVVGNVIREKSGDSS
jgi:hypothetical protein